MIRRKDVFYPFLGGFLTLMLFFVADAFLSIPFLGSALLGVLITISFFVDFAGILTLSLLAAFFLNWEPWLSPELLAFILIPCVVYFIKELIPGESGFNNMLLVIFGILFFYAFILFQAGLISHSFSIFTNFFWGIAISFICGMLLYQIFQIVYET